MAEGLLINHAAPLGVLLGQSCVRKLLGDIAEMRGRGSQVMQIISSSTVRLIYGVEECSELLIQRSVLNVPGEIIGALAKPVEQLGINVTGGEFRKVLDNFILVDLSVDGGAADADNGELSGKKFLSGQVIQRRKQLAFGQVAVCAENNNCAGASALSGNVGARAAGGRGGVFTREAWIGRF